MGKWVCQICKELKAERYESITQKGTFCCVCSDCLEEDNESEIDEGNEYSG